MNADYASTDVRTRTVEDSISQGHDAAYRAAHLTSLILDDLNGLSPEVQNGAMNGGSGGGLVASADYLATRLEALCHELERVRSRLVNNSPKSVADMANVKAQMMTSGRIG